MNKDMYWLWLTNIKGIGRKKTQYLLELYKQPMNIWELESYHINKLKFLTRENKNHLLASRDENRINHIYSLLKEHKITYVSIDHPHYPEYLKHLYDSPYGLYVKGKLPNVKQPSLAIVGARKCSSYGRNVAKYFGQELAKLGFTIISGMARGIDTAAHQGALKGGGKTVAVLGSGVNVCYPSENKSLMEQIQHSGAVISEFSVNAAPLAGHFPLRNRIISGLSDGVLIVEAAEKSGTLITTDMALEQGKNVYAIPGRITDDLSKGTHQLIQSGAKMVTRLEDILEDFSMNETVHKWCQNTIELEENEKIVYDCLNSDPIFIDDIYYETGIAMSELKHLLLKLEIKGLIKQIPNKYFVKVFCGG